RFGLLLQQGLERVLRDELVGLERQRAVGARVDGAPRLGHRGIRVVHERRLVERAHDEDVHRHVGAQARGTHLRREAHAAVDFHGARVAALHLRQELRRFLALDERAAHALLPEGDGEREPDGAGADHKHLRFAHPVIIGCEPAVALGMRRVLAALAFLAFLVCGAAAAQDWPSRPVTLVVPYTPGTGADILARLVGPKLGERWKIGVVTENKAGATGNIGAEFVAKSAPDGQTLLFVATSFTTTPALTASLPFDPVKSFAPIALLATGGLVVVVNPEVRARSLGEFIALARREPGRLNYSSPGNGGP